MPSIGPQYPTSGASSGSPAWSNPGNILASDDSLATVVHMYSSFTSAWLIATGFDFSSIPAGATINGILAEIERSANMNSSSVYMQDYDVFLTKDGTNTVGSDKADTTTKWPTTDGIASYGGAADLWGATWTDAEVKASTFGVLLRARGTTSGPNIIPGVDTVRLTITYTTASGYAHEVNGVAAASIAEVNGVAVASITSINGV
jgi:hypothetical protein